jgi:hypothetical protein
MEWKKEIRFQRDQALAMLPAKEDLMVLAASVVIGVMLFIALYVAEAFHYMLLELSMIF